MTGITTTSATNNSKNLMMIIPSSFVIGCVVALSSQYILQKVFYSFTTYLVQHYLNAESNISIWKVACFSLGWSFITCIIVFIGMIGSMYLLEALFVNKSVTKMDTKETYKDDKNDQDESDEALLFRMELSYVVGAIFAIIMLWTVFDFGILQKHSLIINLDVANMDYYSALLLRQSPAVIVLITMASTLLIVSVFAFFVRALCNMIYAIIGQQTSEDSEDVETGSIAKERLSPAAFCTSPNSKEWIVFTAASSFGLVIGVGTQLLLSLLLWNSLNNIPYVIESNVTIALYSFGWSSVTVVITAIACFLLRAFVWNYILLNMNSQSHYHKNTLLLRMEAMFIGWTLTGICVGWIVLDILHDMTSQIYVSISLFFLSLSCFCCILYYFPESDAICDSAEETLTEPLLSMDDENVESENRKVVVL